MRLRKALALTALGISLLVTAAAPHAATAAPTAPAPVDVGTGGGARPAPALPSRAQATCGDGKSSTFPIGARIRGGPAVYRAGAGAQAWLLDLTNNTNTTCTAIHPVLVFTDQARVLRPAHLRMEFDAPGGPYAVSLEHTDRDEIIAVFDGGEAFPGFAVGAGGSVTVKVRLAFTADAPHGEVLADAALVQRKGDHGDDGDWVGEAGGYRFSVEGPDDSGGDGTTDGGSTVDGGDQDGSETAGSLAHTGPRTGTYGAGALAALTAGAGLLLAARRPRTPAGRTGSAGSAEPAAPAEPSAR
ncbi:hypothetical protein ACIRP0_32435 [Streptomyces sp. NPDC101733]|uniref:hypothetical protein n=1 Tax=unclassified Streptomyces TaxID=2593676 RepID=UPI0038205066